MAAAGMGSGSVGEVEADRRGVAQVDGGRLEGEELALVVATLVLELGVDVNAVNQASDTALHAAAAKGYRSVVQALPDRGAEIEVRNKRGQTPLALTAQPPPPGLVVYQPDLEGMGHLLRKFGGKGKGVRGGAIA